MQFKPSLFAIIVVSILLTGCAGKQLPHNHIESAARSHVETVDAYLAVPQDEIYANIENSNITTYTGGGLLFALVDAAINKSRTSDAEKTVQPIRDNLIDYDYAEALAREINTELKTIQWFKTSDLVLERSIGDGRFLKKFETSKASAVLFMTADYSLNPDFNIVTTRMALIMFPNVEALKEYKEKRDKNDSPVDNDDNIYRKDIIHTVPLGLNGDMETNAAKLSEKGSDVLQKALSQSAREIARKIVQDINLDETVDVAG